MVIVCVALIFALVVISCGLSWLHYTERKTLVNMIIAKDKHELFLLENKEQPKLKVVHRPLSDEAEAEIEALRS